MRPIDADVLRSRICKAMDAQYCASQGGQFDDGTGEMLADFCLELDSQPTLEVNPVKCGHWEFVPDKNKNCKKFWWDCSECGNRVGEGLAVSVCTKFCPRCGCRMRMEE